MPPDSKPIGLRLFPPSQSKKPWPFRAPGHLRRSSRVDQPATELTTSRIPLKNEPAAARRVRVKTEVNEPDVKLETQDVDAKPKLNFKQEPDVKQEAKVEALDGPSLQELAQQRQARRFLLERLRHMHQTRPAGYPTTPPRPSKFLDFDDVEHPCHIPSPTSTNAAGRLRRWSIAKVDGRLAYALEHGVVTEEQIEAAFRSLDAVKLEDWDKFDLNTVDVYDSLERIREEKARKEALKNEQLRAMAQHFLALDGNFR